MAYPNVNSTVSKIVLEAKLQVFSEISELLDSLKVDETVYEALATYEQSMKDAHKSVKASKSASSSDGEKKKRAPSLFNLFIKDVMDKVKADNPDVKNGKEYIKLASAYWKESDYSKFIQEKVAEFKKESDGAKLEELFARAKALYQPTAVDAEMKADSDDEKPESKPTKAKASKPKKGKSKKDDSDSE